MFLHLLIFETLKLLFAFTLFQYSGKEPWQGMHQYFSVACFDSGLFGSFFVQIIYMSVRVAALAKHLEAYTSGSTTGDVEYAVINLYYVNMATFGGCEDLESCSENIQ